MVRLFTLSGVEELCRRRGEPVRKPQEGDLFLACSDALIAAQTAVVAAESLGIGSCYIGDIMENYEAAQGSVRAARIPLSNLPSLFRLSHRAAEKRPLTPLRRKFVVFPDRYRRLEEADFAGDVS